MSDSIDEFVANSIDPGRVRRALTNLSAAWPADEAPLDTVIGACPADTAALVHLLSVSAAAAEKLVNDPAALAWLMQPKIAHAERGMPQMQAAYEALRKATAGGDSPASSALHGRRVFDERFNVLRRWKQREMLRVGLREIAGWSTVEESTLDLTHLAEICLRVVVEGWMSEVAARWGQPTTAFAVLGMGKFGGEELNYSSDIDVMFFYGEDGNLNPRFTHEEFFRRLAEKIIATFTAADPAGPLFRIDLRLRPEGASGPLVRSLDSMEHYYSAFGETWERMALIKARLVAGSEELGYEFVHRLQPFVFPRSISSDVVEEIAGIKRRIEEEIVGQSSLRRNVKLGYGGIREIEFIAQTLQILHGARHAFLQERNTLKTLRALRQLEIIPHAQMESLIDAYRFLRTVEHRLQIEKEAQTHTLPDKADALERLAKSLKFSRVSAFQAELAKHTEAVRDIFAQVLRTPDKSSIEPPSIDLTFFSDPAHAHKLLGHLDGSAGTARFSARTKKLALKLEPLLLGWLRRIADPDATLTRFVRFMDRYGARGLLLETLLRNPRLLELLVRLFDASRFMTDIVLRRPQLVEEVARGGGLGAPPGVDEHLRGLDRNEEDLSWEDRVRAYRRAELLRIGLRDVLGLAGLREVQCEYSALAEACLIFVQKQLGVAEELTIVAMGKFGGRELSYGADLDVIFIGQNVKAAAAIVHAMTHVTAEGLVFPMDARLRPEGEAGPLACSLAGYEDYFKKRAQVWEAQSLSKARPISGPQQEEYLVFAQRVWRVFGERDDLFTEISAMHERVLKERARQDDLLEFKTGRGGLVQLEFFIQAHQMRSNVWQPNTLEALETLSKQDILPQTCAEKLSASYLFLRRCEAVLRRVEDKPVSTLPASPDEQRHLAVRCGYPEVNAFFADYRAARSSIAELCRWP